MRQDSESGRVIFSFRWSVASSFCQPALVSKSKSTKNKMYRKFASGVLLLGYLVYSPIFWERISIQMQGNTSKVSGPEQMQKTIKNFFPVSAPILVFVFEGLRFTLRIFSFRPEHPGNGGPTELLGYCKLKKGFGAVWMEMCF